MVTNFDYSNNFRKRFRILKDDTVVGSFDHSNDHSNVHSNEAESSVNFPTHNNQTGCDDDVTYARDLTQKKFRGWLIVHFEMALKQSRGTNKIR